MRWTRREFVISSLGLLSQAAMAGPSSALCRPLISGNLWWYHPDSFSLETWARELDEQRAIGFDLLWLSNVTSAVQDEKGLSALGGLLDACEARSIGVILDTGFSPNWYGNLDAKKEAEACGTIISSIGKHFGTHKAFSAWYIPHEIYMTWGNFAAYIDALYPALVTQCKRAAEKPVTVSPFFILDKDQIFGNFRYAEPEEYQAYWSALLRRSGIDVVMLQDSGEHFSYVTNKMRRPFFAAMQAACKEAGADLWGNVECAEFECKSPKRYLELYGRVHHSTVKDAPWRAVPLPRMEKKLGLAAEHCSRIVTWGYQQYGRPALGPAAQTWYDAYLRYARKEMQAS